MTASWITPEEVLPKPKNWKAEEYNVITVPENVIKTIDEGDIIDLGNVHVKVWRQKNHIHASGTKVPVMYKFSGRLVL